MKLCPRAVFRLALSLLAATAVWLLAPAARAAAPLCDMRGATAIAPTPTLDTEGGSADAAAPADCSAPSATEHTLDRDRSRSGAGLDDQGPRASLPAEVHVRPATPTAALARAVETFTVSPGARARVERPPRA